MQFHQKLICWYSVYKRDLPWRSTTNTYYIWLSEIIMQQTQVKQGLPYYMAFLETYPTVFDLANATEQDVLKLWQGLGYYSRARHLHTTAKHVAFNLNGQFPNTYKGLLKLKGIGDYTASAIASFSFNEVAAVVDGNVYRVLSRYFGMDTPINSTAGIKAFKTLASSLICTNDPSTYNQAIMEFGAIQCKPKQPNCLSCPLQEGCVAYQKQLVEVLPVKLKKTKVKTKYFNFLVCTDANGHILLEKRHQKGIWQNLYQFPLIETHSSLNIADFETLCTDHDMLNNLDITDWSLFNTTDKVHKLTHQHLHTKFWIVEAKQLPTSAIKCNEITKYPVPVLISDFINEYSGLCF